MQKKQIAKNIGLSVSAQAVSFAVSLLTGLVVPKFIDEFQYAHWQAYILYVGYVGILHFGIIDGLVLRYARYDYDQLDRKAVRSQFHILLLLDTIIAVFVGAIFQLTSTGYMKEVSLYVAIGIVTKNLFTYSSYQLQMTNRIKHYAGVVVSQRFLYGILVVGLLLLKVNNFAWYCIADLFCDIVATAYAFGCSKELYIGRDLEKRAAVKETLVSASAGVFVLIANWSSNLLIGSGKMIVQWHWDELLFGKMSFAFSISNLFLTFVSAISIVLFPSLKRTNPEELPGLYMKIRSAVSPVLFVVLLFYFPGSWILSKWLPKYQTSLVYLGILLPIIVYTTKVNLLTNNYLKAYRKERLMLYINLFSIAIGIGLYSLSAFGFDNITMLLICIVAVLMMRSILSEIAVTRLIHIRLYKEFIIEGIMTVVFLVCANYLSLWKGFLAYAAVVMIYLFFYRENLKMITSKIRRKS